MQTFLASAAALLATAGACTSAPTIQVTPEEDGAVSRPPDSSTNATWQIRLRTANGVRAWTVRASVRREDTAPGRPGVPIDLTWVSAQGRGGASASGSTRTSLRADLLSTGLTPLHTPAAASAAEALLGLRTALPPEQSGAGDQALEALAQQLRLVLTIPDVAHGLAGMLPRPSLRDHAEFQRALGRTTGTPASRLHRACMRVAPADRLAGADARWTNVVGVFVHRTQLAVVRVESSPPDPGSMDHGIRRIVVEVPRRPGDALLIERL